jgi:hypothetical protein
VKARDLWERLLDEGDDEAADAALRGAARLEAEADHLTRAIQAADAKLAEWPATPDLDAGLESLRELRDAVHARGSGAETVSELRAHLRASLAVVLLDFDEGNLFGTFRMRVTNRVLRGAVQVIPEELGDLRDWPDIVTVASGVSGVFPDEQRAEVYANLLNEREAANTTS